MVQSYRKTTGVCGFSRMACSFVKVNSVREEVEGTSMPLVLSPVITANHADS